jgi:hypothetical protein
MQPTHSSARRNPHHPVESSRTFEKQEYVGLSLGLQANAGSSANRGNALGKFTLTDYCVELFPLLKCRKKRECFAVG